MKTKNINRKIIVFILVVALILITAFTAYAAFTSLSNKANVSTFGFQTIEISEDKFEISSDDIINDNEPFAKNPTITNTGSSPCYIRVYLGFSNYSLQKENVKININDSWSQQGDGYYYYNKALQPDEKIEFFNEVAVTGVEKFDCSIFIYADSINTNNLSLSEAWRLYDIEVDM